MKPIHIFNMILIVFSLLFASGCGDLPIPANPSVVFTPADPSAVTPDALNLTKKVLDTRLGHDVLSGKWNINIQNNALRVDLSNVKDVPIVTELVTEAGAFTFFGSDAPRTVGVPVPADAAVIISGADVADAVATPDPATKAWTIEILFTDSGRIKIADYTQSHIGKFLIVAKDGKVIYSPMISGAILGGNAAINGAFGQTTAKILAAELGSGPLPLQWALVK